MTNDLRLKLTEYYFIKDIHPVKFRCLKQTTCRQFAYHGKMTETKMSMVGSLYGQEYPKIVVVSLDPPAEPDDVFLGAQQRTTEYVARIHESEDFAIKRQGSHWAMTGNQ